MPKQPDVEPMRVGFAWFDRAQWQRLAEVVPDRNELDDTFEEWERSASNALKDLERSGQRIEKVPITVDQLLAWCVLRGMVPDGKARSEYVAEILQRKYRNES
jgi:hypothetical protein